MDNLKSLITNMDKRLDWNQYFMSVAYLTSNRSPCQRLQVGCVLVKDKRIISCGYNGFLPGHPHISRVRDNHEQSTIHAEQNCISDCANRGVSTKGAIAYITHYPCIHCCKLLIASGIQLIIYSENYKNDAIVKELLQENRELTIKSIDEIRTGRNPSGVREYPHEKPDNQRNYEKQFTNLHRGKRTDRFR